ncbi:hypothetical protein RJ641_024251, partial [Dillenia turbinata]
MVEQGKVLNTSGAEKQTKQVDLEKPVLKTTSESVWELIPEENGLGKEISETSGKVFLIGHEPPLFPDPKVKRQPTENKGKMQSKIRISKVTPIPVGQYQESLSTRMRKINKNKLQVDLVTLLLLQRIQVQRHESLISPTQIAQTTREF